MCSAGEGRRLGRGQLRIFIRIDDNHCQKAQHMHIQDYLVPPLSAGVVVVLVVPVVVCMHGWCGGWY